MAGSYEYKNPESRPIGTDPKIVKPYYRADMRRMELHKDQDLCCIIKDIYSKSKEERIRLWSRIAMRMAKNMYAGLLDYKEMLAELGVNRVPIRFPIDERPYKERWMTRPRLFGWDNLCSTLRDIFITSKDEEVKLLCRMGVQKAKGLYCRLQEHKEALMENGVKVDKQVRVHWQLRKVGLKVNNGNHRLPAP